MTETGTNGRIAAGEAIGIARDMLQQLAGKHAESVSGVNRTEDGWAILLDIELLTIKLRLLIASVDTAKEMGIDWWQNDPFLTGKSSNGDKRPELTERLERIESALEVLARERQ